MANPTNWPERKPMFKSKVEKVDLSKCVDTINPRQLESYDIGQMADEIKELDFVLLNKPLVYKPTEQFRLKFSLKEGQVTPLQGHRRIAGLKLIVENFEDYGLTKEQANALLFQECEVYENLTEDEARTLAFDEKYHKSLKQWEVVLDMFRQFKLGRDITEVSLRCGKVICESRMITKGPSIWTKYVTTRDGQEKRNLLLKGVANIVKHVKYAFVLGSLIEDNVIKYYKYTRDGIQKPEDTLIDFKADWSGVNALYTTKINSKSDWTGPITEIEYDQDSQVKTVIGGCEETTEVLKGLVEKMTNPKPRETKGFTEKQKKEILDTTTHPVLRELVTMFIENETWDGRIAADTELNRLRLFTEELRKVFDQLPKDRQELAIALLGERNIKKAIEVWTTVPQQISKKLKNKAS
jgi:hypothetical protein